MRNAVGVRCSLSGPCAGVQDWPMLVGEKISGTIRPIRHWRTPLLAFDKVGWPSQADAMDTISTSLELVIRFRYGKLAN